MPYEDWTGIMRQKGKVCGPNSAVVEDIILWHFVGINILWNVSNLSPNETMSQPKDLNLQSRKLYINLLAPEFYI